MSSGASPAARNAACAGTIAGITHVSVHVGAASNTGAGEAAGGSPAYARKPVTLGTPGAVGPLGASDQPATDGVAWSGMLTFDVPAGSYLSWGTWGSSSGGAFYVSGDFPAPFAPTGQATMQFAIGVRVNIGA